MMFLKCMCAETSHAIPWLNLQEADAESGGGACTRCCGLQRWPIDGEDSDEEAPAASAKQVSATHSVFQYDDGCDPSARIGTGLGAGRPTPTLLGAPAWAEDQHREA